jgi:1,6-anhydro-N-acetylmuramate kinase
MSGIMDAMFPLASLPPGVPWTVLGLMAGTSADGVDAALIRVAPTGFRNGTPFLKFLGHYHDPYPPKLRKAVLAAARELRTWGPALPPGTALLVSGGGGRHRRVRRERVQRLPELRPEDDLQFPPGAREAVSWTLLGAASAAGVPGNLPEVTGAGKAVVLGSWVPG